MCWSRISSASPLSEYLSGMLQCTWRKLIRENTLSLKGCRWSTSQVFERLASAVWETSLTSEAESRFLGHLHRCSETAVCSLLGMKLIRLHMSKNISSSRTIQRVLGTSTSGGKCCFFHGATEQSTLPIMHCVPRLNCKKNPIFSSGNTCVPCKIKVRHIVPQPLFTAVQTLSIV